MTAGDNNPRLFASTVSLDTWRSPFSGGRGEADLHIDVVFEKGGRVGGGDAPVRFRLSLRRAEVHVVRDSGGVLDINRKSILRTPRSLTKKQTTTEKKTQISGGIGAGLSVSSPKLEAQTKASSALTITTKIEHSEDDSPMEIILWKTERGYAFRIGSKERNGRLTGQPWNPNVPVMKIRDSNSGRNKGEPPEVRVEIHCLREDLVIEDVEFTSSKIPLWPTLSRKRQIVVEQYIKDELARRGLPCGDLSDPFSRIVLADASPVVES